MKTRRSDRVHLVFPIQGIGTDAEGNLFEGNGHTVVISRHGAVIALNRKLAVEHQLTVRCIGKKRETKARVFESARRRPQPEIKPLAGEVTTVEWQSVLLRLEWPISTNQD
jgi:hypothetical protein